MPTLNTKNTWALATKEGKIIEKFRSKQTARSFKSHFESIYFTKLEIVRLE